MKKDAQDNASSFLQVYLTLNSLSLILHTLRNRADNILDRAGIDLRADQLPVFLLVCEKKMLCQQDIADTLSRDKSSVQRTIACLERLHYVKVSMQPGDRRKKLISLTDQGGALFDKLRNDLSGRVYRRLHSHLFQIHCHARRFQSRITLPPGACQSRSE